MAVANPRHATVFAGCVVPRLSEARLPPKNAFAAVAAKAIPDTGLWADFCCLELSFLNNIQSALAPTALAAGTA